MHEYTPRWSTGDEIDFINRLGNHSTRQTPRLNLLLLYEEYLELRHNWANLNRQVVKYKAKKEIRKEMIRGVTSESPERPPLRYDPQGSVIPIQKAQR